MIDLDKDRVLGADQILMEIRQFKRLAPKGLPDSEIAHRMVIPVEDVPRIRKLILNGNVKLVELKIPYNARVLLGGQGISTLNDLCSTTDKELLAIRGIGPKTLQKLKRAACLFMGAKEEDL